MRVRWGRASRACVALTAVLIAASQLYLWWLRPQLATSPAVSQPAQRHPEAELSHQTTAELVQCDPKVARLQFDLDPLVRQMVADDRLIAPHWAWPRRRLQDMWPAWIEAARVHAGQTGDATVKQVLVVPGVLLATRFATSEAIRAGGPLGDLVQWADLIAGLHVLGHNVTVMKDMYEAARGFRYSRFLWSPRQGCKLSDFDLVYVDIIALKEFPKDVLRKYRCKFRVLDAYGTEAMFNDEAYAKRHHLVTIYGGLSLNLQQFTTFYPHTPDNSFLGFVVQPVTSSQHIKRENIGLLYGKDSEYFKANVAYIRHLQKFMKVHSTVVNASGLPSGVVNHGVLTPGEYQDVLSRSKFFIGVGFPLESSGVMEAIAHGAVFLNPAFKGAQRNVLRENGKPTARQMSSQVPYLEHYVAQPYVYTVDIDDFKSVDQALLKAYTTKVAFGFVPYEFTIEGFLQRLTAYTRHQDFCTPHPGRPPWPPLSALTVVTATDNTSCTAACRSKGLMCEPSFFAQINETKSFQRLACTRYATAADVYLPAVHPASGACTLQRDAALHSCSGALAGWRRLCPCRDHIPQQVFGFVPYEFTMEGFLQRLTAYTRHQDFCTPHPGRPPWPPLSALTVVTATDNTSCTAACRSKGLMCEPSFFAQINETKSFQRLACTRYATAADVYLPAVHPASGACTLQRDAALHSCSGALAGWRRLCPCRDHIPQQVALCKQCLNAQRPARRGQPSRAKRGYLKRANNWVRLGS